MPIDTQNQVLFVADAPSAPAGVTFEFEGEPVRAPAGASVAAALLLHGAGRFRSTPVTGAARAPWCMMGVCFDCLVEIDGQPGRQSCLTPARDGMVVRRQEGAATVAWEASDER